MNINSVKLIYFSPNKTTKRVLEGIAQGIQVERIDHLDLTPPAAKTQEFGEMQDEFVIIGAPVYGGRVAIEAVKRVHRIKVNQIPAVIVVVYGNRAYEDALLELKNLTVEAGFIPIAGGAFIGEHSHSNEITPIACGRPGVEDLKKAREFGMLIRKKMRDTNFLNEIPPLQVPGNFPYKERRNRPKVSPVTRKTLCTLCGTCATVCPNGAITVSHMVMTDPDGCISCCSCIKNCPTQARIFEAPEVKKIAEWLSKNCRDRKEPEIYV
jgi:ferredoxin